MQFDGEGIEFKQSKTGRKVWAPLSPATLRMLKKTPRVAVQIVTGKEGKLIGHRGYFARVYREIRAETDMRQDLTFKDLRRTAATEVLAWGGRAEPLTGHMPGSPVIRVYEVPNRDAALAAQKARRKGTGTKSLEA